MNDIPEIVANPSGPAAGGDLNSISLLGVKYDIPSITVDDILDENSDNPIANSAVTSAIIGVKDNIADMGDISIHSDQKTALVHGAVRNLQTITLTPGKYLISAQAYVYLAGFIGVVEITMRNDTDSVNIKGFGDSLNIAASNTISDYYLNGFGIIETDHNIDIIFRIETNQSASGTSQNYNCQSDITIFKFVDL